MKTFDLIVEKRGDRAGLELTRLQWDGDYPPDIVILSGYGTLLMKVGRYASPGDRYGYRVADVARLTNGKLVAVANPAMEDEPPPEAA